MRKAEPTREIYQIYLSLPKRDDGDGRDDVSGSRGGVKNTVTIVTTVTEPKRTFVPAAQSADCTADRRRKYTDFLRIWTAGCFVKQNRWPCRICKWVPCKHGRGFRRSRSLPPARRQPRHFAAGTDERCHNGLLHFENAFPSAYSVYTDLKWRYTAYGKK